MPLVRRASGLAGLSSHPSETLAAPESQRSRAGLEWLILRWFRVLKKRRGTNQTARSTTLSPAVLYLLRIQKLEGHTLRPSGVGMKVRVSSGMRV